MKVGNSADKKKKKKNTQKKTVKKKKKKNPSPVQTTISIEKQSHLIKSLTSLFSLNILVSARAGNICRNHSHLY